MEWLELGGSLGRGAGDERSDIDAGVGVAQPADRLDAIEAALARLAPVAATLRQSLGDDGTHVITIYDDARHLSLVVLPAATRKGLPPQAIALVDKTGRLDSRIDPDRWTPDAAARREWTFLTCIALSDVHKHAGRGKGWRAIRSLNEASCSRSSSSTDCRT